MAYGMKKQGYSLGRAKNKKDMRKMMSDQLKKLKKKYKK